MILFDKMKSHHPEYQPIRWIHGEERAQEEIPEILELNHKDNNQESNPGSGLTKA